MEFRTEHRSVRTFLILAVLLFAERAAAQVSHDSLGTDDEARRILDEPGITLEDPDEVFEYLDNIPPQTGDALSRRHIDPEVSWIMAHRSIRSQAALSSDSNSTLSLRSRGGRPFDPYAQHGYTANEYLGSPNSYYDRIEARAPLVQFSVLQEKYSWEPDFTDRLLGFVSLSHPQELGSGIRLEGAIAGDYALAFGNGLLFGGGVSSAKSFSAASAAEERSFGIRGSLSTAPARSFRGVATGLSIGNAAITLFASDEPVDANVANDTIQTLYTTDYHRTDGELAVKDAAQMRVLGLRASMSNDDTSSLYLSAGVTAYELRYDHPFTGTNSNPFIGSAARSAGMDLLAIGTKFSSTTEVAFASDDTAQRIAFSTAWVFQPSHDIGLSIVYRHIPYGFISPFGETSGAAIGSLANSDGIYFGIQGDPIARVLHVSGYAELKSTLLPISNLFPKQKHDYLAASYLTLIPGILEVSTIVRSQSNMDIAAIPLLASDEFATLLTDRTSIRIQAAYSDGPFREKIRYDHVAVSSEIDNETGFLVMEESIVTIRPVQTNVTLSASRFQTDSYASAISLYEAGVPGVGVSTPFDGKGWHFSIRTSTQAFSNLKISAAANGTVYDRTRIFGSGLTARSSKTDLAFQLQADFTI